MSEQTHGTGHDYKRKFLVVIDETEECDRAVTFAAYRVKRTGGTVVLLSIVGGDEFHHWLGVQDILRAEALETAEQLLEQRSKRIAGIGNIKIEKIVREGRKAVEALIAEDKDIAILVLAAGTSSEGPGPLVSAFTARGANALPIPVTIIPGSLSDEDIVALC